MSTTYHFVKVAAGEPFSLPTGNYSYNYTGKLDSTIYYDDFINGGHSKHDVYILRPVEPAADGGREALKEAMEECERLAGLVEYWQKKYDDEHPRYMKSLDFNQSTPVLTKEPSPVDNVALLEWAGVERWQLLNAVYHATGKTVWHNNKTDRKVTTAALIQEFINQQTKEV